MKLTWSEEAREDYLYWQETDKRMVKKINELIKDIRRTPFESKGKPEPLKYNLSGFWSRRITEEHRLVYALTDDALLIAACRYHY
ncbi:TPA: Txe/YoeB family addiction module toxin [Salmonella enterica subsp. enterica serovar Ball]|uniref:Txe/YoeB family addiction module toxin n=1 Tax=Salmonella enterica TaxID=28901 RepID=UPI001C437F98|nr:Txe/YoeB family addiction module toxin [Salmonella enterica]EED7470176.1 Txe/YoeB family addiction module toxin [Salmonella enterica subsp. salamae]HCA3433697.1 Txe/YoeB family addiction module toxin [Salmonella enterica subsp. enterica serovar Ball]ELA4569129.1 Txe/YoeB family addiction module toxin [Salmonella enterica]HCA3486382.1 Txe/YoeB family addiction module toxin [Salmonella enterica subsp. enterica serovar Ball]HCA3560843.1 Txe/YoeB family addiction module toxin [Salmonella enteri